MRKRKKSRKRLNAEYYYKNREEICEKRRLRYRRDKEKNNEKNK